MVCPEQDFPGNFLVGEIILLTGSVRAGFIEPGGRQTGVYFRLSGGSQKNRLSMVFGKEYLHWRNLNAVALSNTSEAQRELILYKNAARLLKLESA